MYFFAFPPSFAQGASQSIEGAYELFESIENNSDTNFFKNRVNKTKMVNNRSKPRIPFGSLVELGIIKPGTTIFDNKKKISAKIMVDGSIKHAQTEGSIHKVAAIILGAESCNGWTYWHCELGNTFVPINDLRQKFLSKSYL